MTDYVSRDDVRRFIADAFSDGHFATNYDYAILFDKIDEIPAADVKPAEKVDDYRILLKECECKFNYLIDCGLESCSEMMALKKLINKIQTIL